MLYNVAIDKTARERSRLPFLIKMESEARVPPYVVDAAENLLDHLPPELHFHEKAAGMMGTMVYDPEDEQGRASARGGLFGVPLWLGSTALQTPAGGSHPDKVWLVSDGLSFRNAAIVGDHQFCNRGKAGKLPAAVYMMAIRRAQLDRLHRSVEDSFDYDADDAVEAVMADLHVDDQTSLQALQGKYGLRSFSYQHMEPGHPVREGIGLRFMDDSEILLPTHEKWRIDLSKMRFGVDSAYFLHLAEECSRH